MWDESLSGFLDYCRGQGSAERSVDFYSRWLRAFAEWCASRGIHNLSDVTPSVVTAWRDDCLHRLRHSVATVRVRQNFFHGILTGSDTPILAVGYHLTGAVVTGAALWRYWALPKPRAQATRAA